jgi:hypothetical protein
VHRSFRAGPADVPARSQTNRDVLPGTGYFNALETLLNVVFNFDPRPWTVAIIATAMPAAISPYSMAVAPELSFKNRIASRDMFEPLGLSYHRRRSYEQASCEVAN